MNSRKPTPNYFWSMLTMKCPRCRRGPMFTNPNPFNSLKLSRMMDMPDCCPVCNQKYNLEDGFWFGTGYVSYALAVAVSVASFVVWYVLIGISTDDNRIFWWLGTNTGILVITQPWLMRLSRTIYIRLFVKYDPNYEETEPTVLH